MSIKIMSALWEMDFPPTEKLVFLALADCANDEGLAWPSIATIARKTGVSDRSVQRAIRMGETRGLIVREEVKGKGCRYWISPRHSVTPDTVSRVTNATKTPDTMSPHPRHSVTQTIREPSKEPSKIIQRLPVAKPDEVDADVWADFCAHRVRKKSDITDTAIRSIAKQAGLAGWSLNDALAESVTRGWVSFKAEWVESKNGRTSDDSMGRTERAAIQALSDIGAASTGCGASAGGTSALRLVGSDAPFDAKPNAVLAIGHDGSGSSGMVESGHHDDWRYSA
jgi:hypothetical protein